MKVLIQWFRDLSFTGKAMTIFGLFFVISMLSIIIFNEPIVNLIIDNLPQPVDDIVRWCMRGFIVVASALILWKILVVWLIRPVTLLTKKKKEEDQSTG